MPKRIDIQPSLQQFFEQIQKETLAEVTEQLQENPPSYEPYSSPKTGIIFAPLEQLKALINRSIG